MMLNRITPPAFKQVENIELIQASSLVLDNGIKVFEINAGDQEIVRIEFIFENVNWDVVKPLQAFAANSMLVEGTSKLTSVQIAEKIDFYGAFLQTDYNYDQSVVTLYTLNKHLPVTLPIVREIITDSVFPQQELETFIRNQKQKLNVNLEKNDFVSRRLFNKALFGNSIYGYTVDAEDYEKLDRSQLIEYFNQAYQPANCTILISGKVSHNAVDLLNQYFGKDWKNRGEILRNKFQFAQGPGSNHYLAKDDALQSAIRIGQVSVNRTHPDFPALQVLNTVLGGYFGSRLMANIREDKGYTYGIGSALVSLQNSGYFFVASEVGADVCQSAIEEIKKEIQQLRTEPVPDEELALVKNYMLGAMLGSLENAFSHADKFKNIYFSGLDYNYYNYYTDTVKNITSEKLLELANVYLDFDAMEKVVVGKI